MLGALGTEPMLRGLDEDPAGVVFLILLPIVLTWLPALLVGLRGNRVWARVLAAGLLKVDAILAACAMLALLFLAWASSDFGDFLEDVRLLMIAGWVVMAVALIVMIAVVRIESDVGPAPRARPAI